jgi:hypothetical protein
MIKNPKTLNAKARFRTANKIKTVKEKQGYWDWEYYVLRLHKRY